MKIIDQIHEFISRNKIRDALVALRNWASSADDKDLLNTINAIEARFHSLRKNEMMGIIDFSTSRRELAIIIRDILECAKEISDNSNVREKTILFLASNPSETSKLQLETEFARISKEIQDGNKNLKLVSEWAVTPANLQKAILNHRPNFIHFAGHGKSAKEIANKDGRGITFNNSILRGGIFLQDSNGNPKLVEIEHITELFEIITGLEGSKIEAVILNACHQEAQARAIARYVPYVIGTNNAIEDNLAIEFSTGFYRGLASKNSTVEFAFNLAKTNIRLEGLDGSHIPVLYCKNQ